MKSGIFPPSWGFPRTYSRWGSQSHMLVVSSSFSHLHHISERTFSRSPNACCPLRWPEWPVWSGANITFTREGGGGTLKSTWWQSQLDLKPRAQTAHCLNGLCVNTVHCLAQKFDTAVESPISSEKSHYTGGLTAPSAT